jgi:hypothetical protein
VHRFGSYCAESVFFRRLSAFKLLQEQWPSSTQPSSLGTSIGPENRSIPKVDARKVGAQFRG